jgi:hypothetical protein
MTSVRGQIADVAPCEMDGQNRLALLIDLGDDHYVTLFIDATNAGLPVGMPVVIVLSYCALTGRCLPVFLVVTIRRGEACSGRTHAIRGYAFDEDEADGFGSFQTDNLQDY